MAARIVKTLNDDGTYDVEGWRENGSAVCPRCGKEAKLFEDVEEWETRTGRVTGWGPGTAECCGLALIVWYEGAFAVELEPEEDAKEAADL